jgi:hypothetical protein
MAMAIKAIPTSATVAVAADGKAEVDLYCGNLSPVAEDFDDPLKWWKVRCFLLFPEHDTEFRGRRIRAR